MIFICLPDHVDKALFADINMECLRWPEKPLILERSGTQYGAMVTKLLGSYCDTLSVESYCKKIKHFRWKLAEIFFFFVHLSWSKFGSRV